MPKKGQRLMKLISLHWKMCKVRGRVHKGRKWIYASLKMFAQKQYRKHNMAKVKGFLTAYQKHLDKLREAGRTVIRLYYLAEMTCEEISKVLLSMKHKFLHL